MPVPEDELERLRAFYAGENVDTGIVPLDPDSELIKKYGEDENAPPVAEKEKEIPEKGTEEDEERVTPRRRKAEKGEAVLMDDEEPTLPVVKERDVEALNAEALAESLRGKEELLQEEVEAEPVWYEGIGRDLYNATRFRKTYKGNEAKNESEEVFERSRQAAVESLKRRINDIEEKINKWKAKIFWASKILNGDKDDNPWPSKEAAMGFLKDELNIEKKQAESPKPVEIKENESGVEVVWYEGIWNDLRGITFLDHELDEDEEVDRFRIAAKLRNKGIELPILSTNRNDVKENGDRERLKSAIGFLKDKELTRSRFFSSRSEAISFLSDMGIGDGAGVERKSTSMEANGDDLIKIAKPGKDGDKELTMASLESRGIKIRGFLEDFEKAVPGQSENQMILLRAVVNWWRMTEEEKRKTPGMVKISEAYASVLGLE